MNPKLSRRHLVALLAAACAVPLSVAASEWPAKPIKLIANSAAGGTIDILARLAANDLSKSLAASVVVENRVGAFGNIGAAAVAKAPADGYTFLVTSGAPVAQNRFLYRKLGFDPLNDLVPVITLAESPLAVFVKADSPYRSLADLVKAGSSNTMNLGSPGNGSLGHLSVELLRHASNAQITHVPFSGGAPAQVSLLGGQIDATVDAAGQYEQQIASGHVRAIALLSEKRDARYPQVATAVEQGYRGLVATVWYGVAAPKGTPPAVVARLNRDLNATLRSPEILQRLRTLSMNPVGGPASEMSGRMSDQANAGWKDAIQRAGISLD
jgi:tripartite-type tricarboxylate transporter receptor subunit TctC